MSKTQTAPAGVKLATLPKALSAELKAQADRTAAYQNEHGTPVKFTGRYTLRRSYYLGTPRILISAIRKGEELSNGWMLDEVYANGPRGLGRETFDALWDLAS
jgi:hypothetical protein